MVLNFTGKAEPEALETAPARRAPVLILGCFAAAAVLAGLVLILALRQPKVSAPPAPVAPLVGIDRALAAPQPSAPQPSAPQPPAAQPAAPPAPRAETPTVPRADASPRPDPVAAKARMLAALRQVPHGVITLSIEDDAGAQAYARQIADLFRQAGWTVDQASAFGAGPRRRGLAAAIGVSPADEAVREAFDAVGFRFAPPPRDAGIIRTPEIFVGVPD